MIQSPKGTQDILPEEAPRWQQLERTAQQVLASYGYREIRPPIFEATELFSRGVGAETDIVSKEMYTFTDRGGRSLTLRPEATVGVMRAVLQHGLLKGAGIERLFYLGPMFRAEKMQRGRYRQFHQLGIEALGGASPELDAEVIDALLSFIEALGITGSELVLNSIGDGACRPQYRERLIAFLEAARAGLCRDCLERLSTNPLRVLDCKNEQCRELVRDAPSILDTLCADCARHFDVVRASLAALGRDFRLDPRLVRGIDYYQRTAFEVVNGGLGAQNALAGGGRYDGLSQTLGGPAIPGVGWAAGLERLVMTMPEGRLGQRIDSALIALDPAARLKGLAIAQRLRRRGEVVVQDFAHSSFKALLRWADRIGARRALIIGPDELLEGVVSVKDLETGEQTKLKEDAL